MKMCVREQLLTKEEVLELLSSIAGWLYCGHLYEKGSAPQEDIKRCYLAVYGEITGEKLPLPLAMRRTS